eukprot:CAMPEP_0175985632 /NCGR_PEP_ID=MMETSP0108-20121206/49684_1 /TAXON_ID=195067 ORGANISM="Goniomonas pacifica, Strain CCMP1869" /NCGR_SAMPLE_ID=MMETSP0108 /ASSEMBLY_ACC=CAM_ASM_000204 /LENGTH=77 /DNA_ID=CAMNT_0017316665 /DNA_START=537 /DNA_END=770 /DNA_ORIENTATION=+
MVLGMHVGVVVQEQLHTVQAAHPGGEVEWGDPVGIHGRVTQAGIDVGPASNKHGGKSCRARYTLCPLKALVAWGEDG